MLTRLMRAIPVLFAVSIAVFLLVQLAPGDVAFDVASGGGLEATPEQVEAARERLGLDDPLPVQYGHWLADTLRGDLGTSLFSSHAVVDLIGNRLPVTLSLTFLSLLIAILIALPVAVISARRPGSLIDRGLMFTTTLGIATPNFVLAILLVFIFSLTLGWLPATGYGGPALEDPFDWLRSLLLPSLTLGFAVAAELAQHLRSSLRETLSQDYVRTARAKGLSERSVWGKHALKNALVPVLTVTGVQIRRLLGGTIVVESVFALPGMGAMAVSAVLHQDMPIVQGVAMVSVVIVLISNFVVDALYAVVNPKIRFT